MTDYGSLVKKHIHKIAPEADLDQLDSDEDLGSSLDLDSMDFFRLLTRLSEDLDLEIPEEEYAKLRSINAIVNYCQSTKEEKNTSS